MKNLIRLLSTSIFLVLFGLTSVAMGQSTQGEEEPSHKDLQIEPDRSVHLQVNEGTWMSLDIHPSGEKMVFEFMGNLFELPIDGGEAVQLTHGMAFDAQPSYNPDGDKIVFISDRSGGDNVWILDLETMETEQRTSGNNYRMQSPIFTPDGDYIIAARTGLRSGVHKLWMYHVDGGNGTEFMDTPDNLKSIEPAFGGDDQYLWFSQRTGDWSYNAILPQYQIAKVDLETGQRHTQTARTGSA
ncbi:TolB family protein, partial [Rhodohalobacter sp.]